MCYFLGRVEFESYKLNSAYIEELNDREIENSSQTDFFVIFSIMKCKSLAGNQIASRDRFSTIITNKYSIPVL